MLGKKWLLATALSAAVFSFGGNARAEDEPQTTEFNAQNDLPEAVMQSAQFYVPDLTVDDWRIQDVKGHPTLYVIDGSSCGRAVKLQVEINGDVREIRFLKLAPGLPPIAPQTSDELPFLVRETAERVLPEVEITEVKSLPGDGESRIYELVGTQLTEDDERAAVALTIEENGDLLEARVVKPLNVEEVATTDEPATPAAPAAEAKDDAAAPAAPKEEVAPNFVLVDLSLADDEQADGSKEELSNEDEAIAESPAITEAGDEEAAAFEQEPSYGGPAAPQVGSDSDEANTEENFPAGEEVTPADPKSDDSADDENADTTVSPTTSQDGDDVVTAADDSDEETATPADSDEQAAPAAKEDPEAAPAADDANDDEQAAPASKEASDEAKTEDDDSASDEASPAAPKSDDAADESTTTDEESVLTSVSATTSQDGDDVVTAADDNADEPAAKDEEASPADDEAPAATTTDDEQQFAPNEDSAAPAADESAVNTDDDTTPAATAGDDESASDGSKDVPHDPSED